MPSRHHRAKTKSKPLVARWLRLDLLLQTTPPSLTNLTSGAVAYPSNAPVGFYRRARLGHCDGIFLCSDKIAPAAESSVRRSYARRSIDAIGYGWSPRGYWLERRCQRLRLFFPSPRLTAPLTDRSISLPTSNTGFLSPDTVFARAARSKSARVSALALLSGKALHPSS